MIEYHRISFEYVIHKRLYTQNNIINDYTFNHITHYWYFKIIDKFLILKY
jgi:hypothetical protein